jgi:hypothetical protein
MAGTIFVSRCFFFRGGVSMPQPLSIVFPDASLMIGNAGDRPLMRHPKLAVLAMETLASWSNVESFMLRLFIQLLGGQGSLAADIYLAFENQTSKSRAIMVAANTLDPKYQALLRAIIAIVQTNQGLRDKLAHHTWGDSRDLPNALLLIDPKASIGGHIDQSKVFVYREVDFGNMIKANDRLCGFGHRLKFILDGHVGEGKLYDQLCAEPEILERLNRPAPQA